MNSLSEKQKIANDNSILQIVAGSHLHGTNVDGSDIDTLGVYIEPSRFILGFHRMDSVSIRAKDESERADSEDVEGNAYGLHRFCSLAINGNPSVIALFYATGQHVLKITPEGQALRGLWRDFVSYRALMAYSGYMDQQFGRLTGVRGQKRINRPALVNKYGYDTKYAMHACRLGFQGLEYARNGGWVEEPIEPVTRQLLIDIREGKVKFDDVVDMARELRDSLKAIVNDHTADIPTHPNVAKIEQFVIDTYRKHFTC